CPTHQGQCSNRQPFLHHDLILLKSMEMWGAASPKRLTFFVNRVFIEMNFSPWRSNHNSSASYPWNYKKNWSYQNSLWDSEWGRYNQRKKLCQSKKLISMK
ncbi:MAG: hypothetical protein VXW13_09360, partial [SAR324 cluster bacterium]|nr:hypothetical protein [SAR324 cluster bacterium]